MNDFTASNGLEIIKRSEHQGGGLKFGAGMDLGLLTGVTAGQANALREFFQAEADERLGRCRTAVDPDFVVYEPREGQPARVLRESTAQVLDYHRSETRSTHPSAFESAARAYFDAHPEPKPWTRAKEGESWYLTITSLGPGTSLRWVAQGSPTRFWSGGLHIAADSNDITDGRPVNAGMS